jgi:hypothetical protein
MVQKIHECLSILRFSSNLEIPILLQNRNQPFPDEGLIVSNDDSMVVGHPNTFLY